MSEIIPKLLAFSILVGFLAILLWHVPRIDLGAVLLLTVALVAWDFFAPGRSK